MKTKYKILIVISGYATFFFTKMEIGRFCWNYLYANQPREPCMVLMQFISEITPSIVVNREGEGIGSWSGTAEGMEPISGGFAVEENIAFLLFFIVIPFLIILVIHYRDKCPKLTS